MDDVKLFCRVCGAAPGGAHDTDCPFRPEITTGELIEELREIRTERKIVADRDKDLVADWRDREGALISRLDAQGMRRASTDLDTATITEDDVPMVVDWDEFLNYCKNNDMMHLLQRRVATAAWKELKDAGIEVPGVEVFVKRTISLRKA